jgi:hypothetical protein
MQASAHSVTTHHICLMLKHGGMSFGGTNGADHATGLMSTRSHICAQLSAAALS